MPTLGPTQKALHALALHLPTGPAPARPMSTPPPAAASTPEDMVLKSLMAGFGHAQVDHPAQATTMQALLEGLTRGRP